MTAASAPGLLVPDWPAPPGVRAAVTLRSGGVSRGPYASFNLATHVGDDPAAVEENRARLRSALGLAREPAWLRQVHGTTVVDAATAAPDVEADAAYATQPGVCCAVLTADCLPILLCDTVGTRVAAVHAGWRGLAAGIVSAAVSRLDTSAGDLLAWIGPGIGAAAYAVGPELRAMFCARDPALAGAFAERDGRWHADLAAIARHELAALGLTRIHAYAGCTFEEADRFYSYRRAAVTGRMASVITLLPP